MRWLIRCTVNVICLTGKMNIKKRECEREKPAKKDESTAVRRCFGGEWGEWNGWREEVEYLL